MILAVPTLPHLPWLTLQAVQVLGVGQCLLGGQVCGRKQPVSRPRQGRSERCGVDMAVAAGAWWPVRCSSAKQGWRSSWGRAEMPGPLGNPWWAAYQAAGKGASAGRRGHICDQALVTIRLPSKEWVGEGSN